MWGLGIDGLLHACPVDACPTGSCVHAVSMMACRRDVLFTGTRAPPPPPPPVGHTHLPVPRLAAPPACPTGQCRATPAANCTSEWLHHCQHPPADACFYVGSRPPGTGPRNGTHGPPHSRPALVSSPPVTTLSPTLRPAAPAACPSTQYRPTTCAACISEWLDDRCGDLALTDYYKPAQWMPAQRAAACMRFH